MSSAPTPSDGAQTQIEQEASLRPLIIQAVVITAIMFVVIVLSAIFLREPLEALAQWIVEELGLVGVFFGVLAADSLTVPIPPDTYLFVAVASHAAVIPMLTVCCIASVLAGSIAYHIGPFIQRLPFLRARLEKFRPRGEQLFLKYGTWTVAIAALSPIPFSITCWLAGIYKMPYRRFVLATFARIPRLVGYYLLFMLGWM